MVVTETDRDRHIVITTSECDEAAVRGGGVWVWGPGRF